VSAGSRPPVPVATAPDEPLTLPCAAEPLPSDPQFGRFENPEPVVQRKKYNELMGKHNTVLSYYFIVGVNIILHRTVKFRLFLTNHQIGQIVTSGPTQKGIISIVKNVLNKICCLFSGGFFRLCKNSINQFETIKKSMPMYYRLTNLLDWYSFQTISAPFPLLSYFYIMERLQ